MTVSGSGLDVLGTSVRLLEGIWDALRSLLKGFPLTGSGKALAWQTGGAAEVLKDLFGIKTKVDMT